MAGGSLGIRSSSYGSLDKQLQISSNIGSNGVVSSNGGGGVLPIQSARKPSKMLKEKERLYHSICKFAGRKKVGMLLLCVVSAVVFCWVLYVGKGEDTQEVITNQSIRLNNSVVIRNPESLAQTEKDSYNFSLALPPPPPPPAFFLGYTLPPGHPCETFTLPPPPADKKRTGPRHEFIYFHFICSFLAYI